MHSPSRPQILLHAAELIDDGSEHEFSCVAITAAHCDLLGDELHNTYPRHSSSALRHLYEDVYGVGAALGGHGFFYDAPHRVFALLTLRAALLARARFD